MSGVTERINAAMPKREHLLPLAGSFVVPVAAKVPWSAAVIAGSFFVLDRIRENPGLMIPAALMTYALITALTVGLDYSVLKRDGATASAKANLFYRGLSFFRPGEHHLNALSAELLSVICNVLGIGLEPSTYAALFLSLQHGDGLFLLAQRVSAVTVGVAFETTQALFYRARGGKRLGLVRERDMSG